MADLDLPLRFEPFLRPMVWGGRLLEKLGKKLPTNEPYGESWEVSDHALAQSVVAEGPWTGSTLRLLMESQRQALLGQAHIQHAVFPWLFKFLDAEDRLSVQVHPDAVSVKKLWPGEGPKNEAWFVLEARPGSWVYAGLLPGVEPADMDAALRRGSVEECLHRFEPRAGDCLYLSAGTVHAVGGGVLLAEIQQTSDATFRLFDWNRRDDKGQSRKLHIEESLACLDWQRGPINPLHVAEYASAGGQARRRLLESPYFCLDFIKETAPFAVGGQGRLAAFCVFKGQAELATGQTLSAGQVWLLPATMPVISCRPLPSIAGMFCTLP